MPTTSSSIIFNSQESKKTNTSKSESAKKSFKRALSLNNVSEKRKNKETEQNTKVTTKSKPLVPYRANLRRNSIPPEKGTFEKKPNTNTAKKSKQSSKKDKKPFESNKVPKSSISEIVQKGMLNVQNSNLQRRKSHESLDESLRKD